MNFGPRNHFWAVLFAARILAIVALAAVPALGQITRDSLRAALVRDAGFSAEEIAALETGQKVVRTIETADKQETAVCGVVRLDGLPEFTLDAFRSSLSPKRERSIGPGERFSSPPEKDDLAELRLEAGDIEELKKCEVGNCDLNMSARMIRRVRTEIDWAAGDHPDRVNMLFRQMLAEMAAAYTLRGNSALEDYANRKRPVQIARDHLRLLETALLLKEAAPELYRYLIDFPAAGPSVVESNIYWSTVDFGLKPMITISHVAAWAGDDSAGRQSIVATKQIYASRYLDSSFSLAMLLRVPAAERVETYLIFTDRSRSDALEGVLGDLTRRVVRNEAIERVTGILDAAETRLRAEAMRHSANDSEQRERTALERITNQLLDPAVQVILVVLAFGAGLLLYRRARRRTG